MEHKGLHHGDIDHLLSENKIVALGRVHTTEPSDLCHGELLGNGFCSISIDKCLDIQAYLPFPTIDASMVNEVVGGFVKWDIQNVKTVKEVEMNGHTYAATSPNDFIFEANGAPNTEDGISLRESWREHKVMLWSKENTEVLGYGVILLALPYEVINFDLLGEEDVGVVVDKSYNESAGTCTTDDLDCINLVRWPIKRLTFEDRTPLIQEESTKTPTLEDATMVDECGEFIAGHKSIFVRKRTYYIYPSSYEEWEPIECIIGLFFVVLVHIDSQQYTNRTSKSLANEDIFFYDYFYQLQVGNKKSKLVKLALPTDWNTVDWPVPEGTMVEALWNSNSDFNLESISILDVDSTALLDAKTNLDANFNESCGKLDEERSKLMMYNILGIQHNQRSVVQVSNHGKVKKLIQEDFQGLARGQNPLHNSFINSDQKEFPVIKFIQEDSTEEVFAINEQVVLSNNRTKIFAMRFVQEEFVKIGAKLDEVHQNMFLTRCYYAHIFEGKVKIQESVLACYSDRRSQMAFQAFMSHFVEVTEDQEFHTEAFKDVILMTNVHFNFGYGLVVESSADLIGLWSTLGLNRSDMLCFKSIQLVVWQSMFYTIMQDGGVEEKSKGTEVTAWGRSKWKPEKSGSILKPNPNLVAGAELDVAKQADLDFVVEKALETDAEGVAGE
ncbi:hypothetical protein L7F22_067093 [Adiantum nelumboides]|nr:hypothetical protein [Adiantum nelumboides]